MGGDQQRRLVERDGRRRARRPARANRSRGLHGRQRYRSATFGRHDVPGCLRRAPTPDKPPYDHGAPPARSSTYAELDAAANRLSQLFRAAGLQPGDHVAFCLENHPRFFEVAWGAHYAGLVLHGRSLAAHDRASWRTSSTTAAPRRSSRRRYKADQAAEIVADTPGVQLRLMLDGAIDGYEPTRTPSPRYPAEPLPDAVAGHRHALLVGHHRAARRA